MLVNYWFQRTLERVIYDGDRKEGRNGQYRTVFAPDQFKVNLQFGDFPLISLKKCSFKKMMLESLYFLSGSTLVADMPKSLVETWWQPWSDKRSFGKFYGYQLRSKAGYFDQLEYILNLLKHEPSSRRICFSLWCPDEINETVLPACHSSFVQFYVRKGKFLDLKFYQRSGDIMLGVGHNIAWATVLNLLIANEVGLTPGVLKYEVGDCHVYEKHVVQAKKLLEYALDWRNEHPKASIKSAYKGLTIEEVLSVAEQRCLNAKNRWESPIDLVGYKSLVKLGKLELIA